MNTIILGAGITGLSAAHKTKGVIYEATDKPGGICRSYYLNGYRFENGGGHWIFGADQEVQDFLKPFATFKTYKRNAGVYINNIYPYPIQNYFDIDEIVKPGTMKEWLFNKFGADQCRLFFYPFNDKYTAGLYNEIAPQDEHKNPIRSSGYNTEFIYPEDGLDKMIDKMSEGLDIRYNKQVINIKIDEKTLIFKDGEVVKYDRLISTLPLNTFSVNFNFLGKRLPYNSTVVLNIGATKGKNCPTNHWLYTPYSKSGFHRVGFYSNVDSSFAPKNRVSIYVEYAYLNAYVFKYDDAIKELQDWGFIKKVDAVDHTQIDIAYTWQYPNSTERDDLLNVLTMAGVTQYGRYGRWKFCGISESIKEGLSC